MSQGYHFDFREWEDAFAFFYEVKATDDRVCLVVSIHEYTSGYWVEFDSEESPTAHIYKTVEEVKALEARVRNAIAKAEASGRLALGKVIL